MGIKRLVDLMDDAPIALVLGAGASRDFGLPLWDELKSEALKLLNEDTADALNISTSVISDVKHAFLNSGEKTLDTIAGDLGKMPGGLRSRLALQKIIAWAILQCEGIPQTEISDTWIGLLTQFLQEICRKAEIDALTPINIAAVDDFVPSVKLPFYNLTNANLAKRHVICIGLSPSGFNQSKLDLSASKSITFTNTRAELSSFDYTRLTNHSTLYFKDEGLFAKPLMEELTKF